MYRRWHGSHSPRPSAVGQHIAKVLIDIQVQPRLSSRTRCGAKAFAAHHKRHT